MDLKIEIRKLYALHQATIRLDHAIRDIGQTAWIDFAPSRFVYAFFTFNSIYALDWSSSYERRRAIKWTADDLARMPREEEQFKAYLRYVDTVLAPNTSALLSEELSRRLTLYGVTQPLEDLKAVDLVNATRQLRNLAGQLPGEFARLWRGDATGEQFFPSACAVFKFVYEVRCNLFHGRKTRIQLLDAAQQRRLLIYTAALIAGNSLLFRVAEQADIGWRKVDVDFTPRHGRHNRPPRPPIVQHARTPTSQRV